MQYYNSYQNLCHKHYIFPHTQIMRSAVTTTLYVHLLARHVLLIQI